MLKWFAEIFKLTEKQMTRKALNRLKILTLLSLPAVPLIVLDVFGAFSNSTTVSKLSIFAIPYAAFVAISFSKFVNRFWARDKYLDEWEVARKHQAMAFSLQSTSCILILTSLFLILFDLKETKAGIDIGVLSHLQLGTLLLATFIAFLYIAHLFLLFTVKPIDDVPDASVTT